MVGDGMVGSSNDVNQGTTAGGQRTSRGQSPRSSEEAGNDRGAKGGRDVVWAGLEQASHKGPGSAARLFARMRRNTGLEGSGLVHSGPPLTEVSGAKACAAGNDSSQAWSRVSKPVHRQPRTGKPDALCGQQDYVVFRPKDPVFIGTAASATPHNILHGSVLKGSSDVPAAGLLLGIGDRAFATSQSPGFAVLVVFRVNVSGLSGKCQRGRGTRWRAGNGTAFGTCWPSVWRALRVQGSDAEYYVAFETQNAQ
jgi:hypothetical protein